MTDSHGRVAKSPPGCILTIDEWHAQLDDWHYLGASCRGVIYAWGHDEGCCVYTNPRSRMIARQFPDCRVIELARMVGKPDHEWAMTSLMAESLREATRAGYDVCITYADPVAGHNGTVYRAGNWIPDGCSSCERVWTLDGKRISRRSMYDRHGTQSESVCNGIYGDRLQITPGQPKPRFLYGLTKKGRKAIASRR